MFRVSNDAPDRGPLRPIPRPEVDRDKRQEWSRYDVGEQLDKAFYGLTIYGATRRDTAFTEALAWKAATSATYAGLVEEANYTGTSIDALLSELNERGIPIGGVDLAWRESRQIYTLETLEAVWVDVFHRDTVSAIRGLTGLDIDDEPLTLSAITGDNRSLTTHIAETIRGIELQEPSGATHRPLGIRYPSKFGMVADDDYCWAHWLLMPEYGANIKHSEPMDPGDPDVIAAMRTTGAYVP